MSTRLKKAKTISPCDLLIWRISFHLKPHSTATCILFRLKIPGQVMKFGSFTSLITRYHRNCILRRISSCTFEKVPPGPRPSIKIFISRLLKSSSAQVLNESQKHVRHYKKLCLFSSLNKSFLCLRFLVFFFLFSYIFYNSVGGGSWIIRPRFLTILWVFLLIIHY